MKKTYKESWFEFEDFLIDDKIDFDSITLNYDNGKVAIQIESIERGGYIYEYIKVKDYLKYVTEEKIVSGRYAFLNDLGISLKILIDPYAEVKLSRISSIVKQIIDNTSIKKLNEEILRINRILLTWRDAIMNKREDSLISEKGIEVSEESRLLIAYQLITKELLSNSNNLNPDSLEESKKRIYE